jgi:hypothetical protein
MSYRLTSLPNWTEEEGFEDIPEGTEAAEEGTIPPLVTTTTSEHISSHTETVDENVSQPSLLRRIVRGGRVQNQDVPYQSPPSGD